VIQNVRRKCKTKLNIILKIFYKNTIFHRPIASERPKRRKDNYFQDQGEQDLTVCGGDDGDDYDK
jgi:hypothetical protein